MRIKDKDTDTDTGKRKRVNPRVDIAFKFALHTHRLSTGKEPSETLEAAVAQYIDGEEKESVDGSTLPYDGGADAIETMKLQLPTTQKTQLYSNRTMTGKYISQQIEEALVTYARENPVFRNDLQLGVAMTKDMYETSDEPVDAHQENELGDCTTRLDPDRRRLEQAVAAVALHLQAEHGEVDAATWWDRVEAVLDRDIAQDELKPVIDEYRDTGFIQQGPGENGPRYYAEQGNASLLQTPDAAQ